MKKDDRVELVFTNDPYTRLRAGDRGRIVRVSEQLGHVTYDVAWDDGSTLSMIPDSGDRLEVVTDE